VIAVLAVLAFLFKEDLLGDTTGPPVTTTSPPVTTTTTNGPPSAATTTAPPATTTGPTEEPKSYSWAFSGWSQCPCGGGIQTRNVWCRDENSATVANTLCKGVEPSKSQPCNDAVGCETFDWSVGAWGPCSAACAGGTQTRSVLCKSNTGRIVTGDNCTKTRPDAAQSCNTDPCVTYAWHTGTWGPCSCATSTQTRNVVCKDSNGNNVSDGMCSGTKPVTSQSCTPTNCTSGGSWSVGAWGPCSRSCDGGTQTRTVACKWHTGATVSEGACPAPKPDTSRSCNTQPCTSYEWRTAAWGPCSAPCDGTQFRVVDCVRNDGTVLHSWQHDTCVAAIGAKPAESRLCGTDCNAGGSSGPVTMEFRWDNSGGGCQWWWISVVPVLASTEISQALQRANSDKSNHRVIVKGKCYSFGGYTSWDNTLTIRPIPMPCTPGPPLDDFWTGGTLTLTNACP
jgi:hypothetical protein